MNSRYKMLRIARSALKALKGVREVAGIEEADVKLRESLEKINITVTASVERLVSDISFFLKHAEWDTFNVAMFGETNSGKSTLIEAIVRGNGSSIGDGHKDNTRQVSVQPYSNLQVLDMPGIEGKESEVVDEIFKAVQKAHIVFYINGTNKPLERGTTAKMKKYLQEQAAVYSVLNARGKSSRYRHVRGPVLQGDIQSVHKSMKRAFKRSLGPQYRGNISVNAYLAFLARGRRIESRFKSDREKLVSVFGTLKRAKDFSEINQVLSLLDDLSETGPKETVVSNGYKLLGTLEAVSDGLHHAKADYDSALRLFESELRRVGVRVHQGVDLTP